MFKSNSLFNSDAFEDQLAVLMLESLEKSGTISVTSKKQLEEYIFKEVDKNANK